MASFDTIVRSGIALADSLTESLQATVSHSANTGQDNFGADTYAAAISRDAIVEYKARQHQTGSGEIVQTQAKVVFLRPVTITARDKIILPNGSTGPIVDIEGLVDPTTNQLYMIEVWLGLPGSGFGTS